MSRSTFEDDCPLCKPTLVDPATGETMGDNNPSMIAIMVVWEAASRKERKAFHNLCCNNSRVFKDVQLSKALTDRMEKAMKAAPTLIPSRLLDRLN